jgi:uncharacterized protein (DUF1684 family)
VAGLRDPAGHPGRIRSLCRALNIDAPAADGTVTLDFNRAYNLPCAFSDFVPVCPAAPPCNRLPFAVEAGEKIPREKQM